MATIGYKGKLPVAVVLAWQGENIANALSTKYKNGWYIIANEFVTEFTITGAAGATKALIERRAEKGKRFFDDKLNTFTTSPVSGPDLDKVIDPAAKAKFVIDLKFSYQTFFDVLLEQ